MRDAMLRLRAGLKMHFGPEAGIFVDPFLWQIGCVCIDILRLDYWLQKRNPDYKDESMRIFIRHKYGQDAERFVEHWIKGERTVVKYPVEVLKRKDRSCRTSQPFRRRSKISWH